MTRGTAKEAGARQFSVAAESRSRIRSIWIVREVTATGVGDPAYRATSYPDSDLISLETFKTGRPISKFMGRNLLPGIRSAITEAEKLLAEASGATAGEANKGESDAAG